MLCSVSSRHSLQHELEYVNYDASADEAWTDIDTRAKTRAMKFYLLSNGFLFIVVAAVWLRVCQAGKVM